MQITFLLVTNKNDELVLENLHSIIQKYYLLEYLFCFKILGDTLEANFEFYQSKIDEKDIIDFEKDLNIVFEVKMFKVNTQYLINSTKNRFILLEGDDAEECRDLTSI